MSLFYLGLSLVHDLFVSRKQMTTFLTAGHIYYHKICTFMNNLFIYLNVLRFLIPYTFIYLYTYTYFFFTFI